MDTTRATNREVLDATVEHEAEMRPQRVPVNMYEAPEALVVIAPFPAVAPEDVTVQLRGRTLRLSATLRSAGTRDYLLQEWEYGGFDRSLHIPAGFGSAVEASLVNGQLVVRVLRGEPIGDIDATP